MIHNNIDHFSATTVRRADKIKDRNHILTVYRNWATNGSEYNMPDCGEDDDCIYDMLAHMAIDQAKDVLIAEKNSVPVGMLVSFKGDFGIIMGMAHVDMHNELCGVDKILYRYAVRNLHVGMVSLSYPNLKKDIKFWQGLGFNSCEITFFESGNVYPHIVSIYRLSDGQIAPNHFALTCDEIDKAVQLIELKSQITRD